MLRSRVLWRLYAGYALLVLLTTTMVGGLIGQRVAGDSLDEVRRSLEARAALLRELAVASLAESPDPVFQERIRSLGVRIGTRLTLIRADGVVIGDSDEDPARMDDHGSRPEILAARSHGAGIATRFSDTLNTRMMYLALPVEEEGRVLGYVRASVPLSAIDERLRELWVTVALAAGASLFVALGLGFFVARSFSRPVSSMTAVAELMADGNYDQRLPTMRQDELGKLGRAINRMAASSRERMEAITSERNQLLAVLSGMVEGVVAIDREECVLQMNETAARILGTTPESSLGKRIWEVTRVHEVCEVLTQTLQEATDVKGEMRLPGSAADQIVEMHASPLRSGNGKPAGAVIVLHDVSELERLETVRRDLVANVSHELKTPIAAIRGLVETVIDDKEMSPQNQDRFLGKIQAQSLRLSAIVTDLLTLSRFESEGGLLERKTLDLRHPVLASARALVLTGEERGVAVETEVPEVPVRIRGDADALGQVTTNLLDNALKYTPRGGRVWVRLREEGADAVIEVQDTGIGIKPQECGRIFERFYRVDRARSRELGGTGLGLSIVKHILLAHGGSVSVESEPGVGTTFRAVLPGCPISTPCAGREEAVDGLSFENYKDETRD